MAFTREFIRNAAKESGVELPKELEDALVQEHISARDAFSEEQVKAALEKNKPEPAPNVKDTQEYKDLKKEFDAYKAEQANKETRAAKETAYRALLKEAGVNEKRIDAILKVSDVDGVQLDDKGKITDAKDRMKSIKDEWSDFITTTEVQGAQTAHPPVNTGGSTMTREEIFKIRDASDRQRAIAENIEIFRKE